MKQKGLILVMILCAFGCLKAQQVGYYPDFYNSYFLNPYVTNPSWIPDSSKFELNVSRKMLLGELKDVSSSQFNLAFIKNNINKSHLLRGIINTEQEGPYISIPKFMINYALGINLTYKLKIYSGLSLGTTGIYLSAPSSSNSFYMPDGNLGLGVKYQNLIIGCAIMQMLNYERYNFNLKRFYQTNLEYSKELSYLVKLRINGIANLYTDSKKEYRLNLATVFYDKFEAGIGSKNLSTISFSSKISFPLTEHSNKLHIGATYTINKFAKSRNFPNSMELYIGYNLK